MSVWPSTLKSLVPTIFQRTSVSSAGFRKVPDPITAPFMNQATFCPEVSWRQRRSCAPFVLKSPRRYGVLGRTTVSTPMKLLLAPEGPPSSTK